MTYSLSLQPLVSSLGSRPCHMPVATAEPIDTFDQKEHVSEEEADPVDPGDLDSLAPDSEGQTVLKIPYPSARGTNSSNAAEDKTTSLHGNDTKTSKLVRHALLLDNERAKFGDRYVLEENIRRAEKELAQKNRIAEETGRIFSRARSRTEKSTVSPQHDDVTGGNALRRLKSSGGELVRKLSSRRAPPQASKTGNTSSNSASCDSPGQRKQSRHRWFGKKGKLDLRSEAPEDESQRAATTNCTRILPGVLRAKEIERVGREELLMELEMEYHQLCDDADVAEQSLLSAKERFEDLESVEAELRSILDRFYGRLPGWEQDPVAVEMLSHVADMSESAIEAERDLWDRSQLLIKMRAARENYKAGERYVSESVTLLRSVLMDLHEVSILINEERKGSTEGNGEKVKSLKIFEKLESAGVTSRAASSKMKLAVVLVPALPNAKAIASRARSLVENMDGVGSNLAELVLPKEESISTALTRAKSTVADAAAVDRWISKAIWSITQDGKECKSHVKMLEREVVEERMALLRLNYEEFTSLSAAGLSAALQRDMV